MPASTYTIKIKTVISENGGSDESYQLGFNNYNIRYHIVYANIKIAVMTMMTLLPKLAKLRREYADNCT